MAPIFQRFSPARLVTPNSTPAARRPGFGFRGTPVLWMGIILALALAGCSGAAATGGAGDPITPSSTPENPNDFAFTLYQGQERLGAESLNFSDLRGKPVVLNFWAGLCPPCRAEMPEFQEFYDEYQDRVVLLGIDVGQFTSLGNQEDAKALLKALGVTYPAGFTEDPAIMRNFKVLGMPTTVFVDSDGKIFRSWTGALNLRLLSEITDEMLGQEAG